MDIHSKVSELLRRGHQINLERSKLIQEIELMLRQDLDDDVIDMLDSLAEEMGGYITRPWGSDDMIVKLPVGE